MINKKKRKLKGMHGGEEREITWQLRDWDVANGGGTEWSPAVASQGHC
jgi:hypothetical protein